MSDMHDRYFLQFAESTIKELQRSGRDAVDGWDRANKLNAKMLRSWGWTLFVAIGLGLALIIDIAFRGWP